MGLKEEEDKLFGNDPAKPAEGEVQKPAGQPAEGKPLETKLDGEGVPEEYRGKSVSEILEELKTTKSENASLKEVKPPEPAKPAETAKPAGQMSLEDLEKLSFTNPLKASAILFQSLSEPLVKELRGTGERFAKQEIQKKEYYKRYAKEIDEVAAKLEPGLRTNPEAWDRCYDIVVGRHIGEITEEAKQGSTSLSSGNPPPPQKEKIMLNDEQKQIAQQLGLKEEDYIAGMAK